MTDTMPLITARSSTGMLVRWEPTPSSLCYLLNSLGFCLSFTLVDLPDDWSQFDVHGALEDDKVTHLEYTCLIEYIRDTLFILLYHLYHLSIM
jgi:hypothetical protein